jgi:hypothetical protein
MSGRGKPLRILVLLLALHAGCTIGTDGLLRGKAAHSPPLLDGASLAVETRANGPFALGSFQRYVVVRRAGAPVGAGWIGDTLAAVWAINVYQTGPRDLVLARRLQAFDLDTVAGTVRPQSRWPCGKGRPAGATYLGVFDGRGGHERPFRFIPAAEREERPMPQAPEMC